MECGVIQRIISSVRKKGLDREGVRYVIVGGLTTLVNFGVFAVMHRVLKIDVTVSNVTSISISILFAYAANKLVVFKRHCDTRVELVLEFIKFVGSRLFTMAIEVGAVWLFVDILVLNALVGKAASQVLVIILNYIISKLIVFRGMK